MKQVIVVAALMTSIAMVANGQDRMGKQTPQERTEMQTKWMDKNLSLTEEQSTKAHDVVLKYAIKRDSLAKAQQDPAKRQAMQELMHQRNAELKNVLSAEQFGKFKAHQQEMRKKVGERKGNNPNN